MPDTGAPWNIPYVEPSDLVRNYPAANELMADAIAAGLTAAGGLVKVKSALFTGTQTNSTSAGANFAVTSLTITHEVADATNQLILVTTVLAAHDVGFPLVGVSFAQDGALIGTGAAAGSRTLVGSAGVFSSSGSAVVAGTITATHVFTPGAGSKVYTVRATNLRAITGNVFINRTQDDTDTIGRWRGASTFVLLEVRA